MDRGGSFTEGGLPDESGDELDETGLPLRGWVDPDDRLWLHPSEVAKQVAGDAPPATAPAGRRPDRRSQAAALSVVMVAAAVVLLVLVTDGAAGPSSSSLPTGTTTLTTALVPAPAVAAVAARLGRSLVGLLVDRHGRRTVATGTVMAPGDLVVTAASAVAHATEVTAVISSGRRLAARVLGRDPTTGVAVVKVRGLLRPARFAGTASVGQLDMTACMCEQAAGRPTAALAVARVDAVGVRPHGTSPVLDGIEADHVRAAGWGAVLADGAGAVTGILATRTTGDDRTLDVFVPGWLAVDVAHQLAAEHRVVHGWLGVKGTGRSGACGAEVQAVMPGAPAEDALVPGDVVVAVDGRPVCDWPELQASLYVVAPDQPVDLEVEGPAGPTTVAVALSSSPG